jgi:Tfp pilus assembly protein PilO
MEVVQGALDAIGPWISTIGPLPLLFIALVRGWLLTPASVQKVHESQETRITEMRTNYEARLQEAKEREQEWKDKTAEAMEIVQSQAKQLDVVTELGETSVKLLEAVHSARFGLSDEQKAARKTTHVVRPGREG